jgi:hypothetical protein
MARADDALTPEDERVLDAQMQRITEGLIATGRYRLPGSRERHDYERLEHDAVAQFAAWLDTEPALRERVQRQVFNDAFDQVMAEEGYFLEGDYYHRAHGEGGRE